MNDTLSSIDRETLTPIVRRALDCPAAEIVDYASRPLAGGYSGAALYQYHGTATAGGQAVPWRIALKCIRPAQTDPRDAWYWKREVLAYQSGLLENLPEPVVAPRCFQIDELPGGGARLWLEWLTDTVGPSWPLEYYGEAARRLGRFNGAYLTGRPLPDFPWLTGGWLRSYVENAAPAIEFLRENPHHPVVRRWFPGLVRTSFLALWEERAGLLARLEAMPQTFCHHDAFRNNLFAAGPQLAVIDWSSADIGAPGVEITGLVLGSCMLAAFPARRITELEKTVMQGYLRGLQEAGFQPDPAAIRLAFCLDAILRTLLASVQFTLSPESLRAAQDGQAPKTDLNILLLMQHLNFLLIEGLWRVSPGCLGRMLKNSIRVL